MKDKIKKSLLELRKNKKIIILLLMVLIGVCYYFYDRSFGYFTSGDSMNEPRAYHKSLLVNNNEVLITGGLNAPSNEKLGLKSAELYFVKDNSFEKISDTNLPHLYHKMFKMSDGNIVIADVNGIEIYDSEKKSFRLLKSQFAKRYQEFNNYNFQLLPNDRLLIVGGRRECKRVWDDLCNLNKLEIIDLNKDMLVKSLPLKGTGQGLVMLPDGNLLILGGKNYNDKKEFFLDEIYHFNTRSYELSYWGNLPVPMINPYIYITSKDDIVLLGGKIYDGKNISKEFEYARYMGNSKIYVINIVSKAVQEIDISEHLKKYEVFMNQILDVQQISDSLYWLQLRANSRFNSIVLDIDKNEVKNVGTLFVLSTMRYQSSNVKLQDAIVLLGGKLFYQEISEYAIDSEPVFYAKELNRATAEGGFVLDDTVVLKIK